MLMSSTVEVSRWLRSAERLEDGGGEVLRVQVRQRALAGLCRPRAGCGRRRWYQASAMVFLNVFMDHG